MTNSIKWLLLSFALLLSPLFGRVAQANTITAASCSQSDVQTAVSSAVDGRGDTIVVQPAPCTAHWTSAVNVPAVGMTIRPGVGGTVTIDNFGFSIPATSPNVNNLIRITGFTFTDPGPFQSGVAHAINFTTSSTTGPVRIDHNNFNNPTSTSLFIVSYGFGIALIDNNTFTGGGNSENVHISGCGSGCTQGWQDTIIPGGPTMYFLEDNTCTGTSLVPGNVSNLQQAYWGARFVVRHNQLNFCQDDAHGTAGEVGARWFEIYNNVYNTPSTANSRYMDLRGGSGVVWGNSQTGNDLGFITFREEDTGTWPMAYMAGSGINGTTDGHNSCAGGTLNSAPVQVWNNNGIPVNTAQGSPTLGRDYFVTAGTPGSLVFNWEEASGDTCSTTYTYVPYTYPHPLQGGSGTPPAPPTILSAVVQ